MNPLLALLGNQSLPDQRAEFMIAEIERQQGHPLAPEQKAQIVADIQSGPTGMQFDTSTPNPLAQIDPAAMGAEVASPLENVRRLIAEREAAMGPQPQLGPSIALAMRRAQRDQEMAGGLMQPQFVQNSGPLGALAMIAQAFAGRRLDRKADESIEDAVRRQMELQAAQQQYGKQVEELEGYRELIKRGEMAGLVGADVTPEFLLTGKLPDNQTPAAIATLRALQADPSLRELDRERRIEGRAPPQPARPQVINVPTSDGGQRTMLFDPNTGTFSDAGFGGQPQAGPGASPGAEGPQLGIRPPKGAAGSPLPAEARIKLGMLRAAREAARQYEQAVLPTEGGFNRQALFVGPAGGQLDEAINNVLRVESGAAVPDSERAAGMARYGARTLNQESTARANLQLLYDKIDTLERELTGQPAGGQRPAASAPAPSSLRDLSDDELLRQLGGSP